MPLAILDTYTTAQGAGFTRLVTWTDSGGTATSIAGWTVAGTIKHRVTDSDSLAIALTAAIDSAAGGKASYVFTDSQCAGLSRCGPYVMDLTGKAASGQTNVLRMALKVE